MIVPIQTALYYARVVCNGLLATYLVVVWLSNKNILNTLSLLIPMVSTYAETYRIAGMFGGVNVWRIGQIKSIWRKKFGE